jgi:hypothetical protein
MLLEGSSVKRKEGFRPALAAMAVFGGYHT